MIICVYDDELYSIYENLHYHLNDFVTLILYLFFLPTLLLLNGLSNFSNLFLSSFVRELLMSPLNTLAATDNPSYIKILYIMIVLLSKLLITAEVILAKLKSFREHDSIPKHW